MTIGNRITEYRKRLGITQEALAQKLHISNQAVSKWESDQSCPDIQLLPELADIFGISIDALFGRERSAPQSEQTIDHLPWPNDDDLRVVMYLGHKLIAACLAEKDLRCGYPKRVTRVLSVVSMQCGHVEGDVICAGNVNCQNIGGDADAGENVACGDVGGDVDAGGSVTCGHVYGDVDAGGKVICSNVSGDVDAGGSVTCANVSGDVDAGGSIECTRIEGDADAGGNILIKQGPL